MSDDAEDFARRWDAHIKRTDPRGVLARALGPFRLPAPDGRLSAETNDFLTRVGLPGGGGMEFSALRAGLRPLPTVYAPGGWSDADERRLGVYLFLGSDMSGDPLCLDMAHGERVVWLDHETGFALGPFVNSGVRQFAESILAYEELIEAYQGEFGKDAELYESRVPAVMVAATLARIRAVNPPAAAENAYWPRQMDGI